MNLSEYVIEPLPAQPMVFVVHNDTSVRESLGFVYSQRRLAV